MNVVYKDEVPSSVMVIAILGLSVAILASFSYSQFTQPTEMNLGLKIFVFAMLLVGLVVVVSFRKLTIVVTNTQLIFGFGKFRKKVGLGNLTKVEIKDFKFSNYLGYGIRFGRDGSVGYVPRGGKGILITVRGEKKPLFFIVNNPEQIKSVLDKYVK
jgi:hypothetical protein